MYNMVRLSGCKRIPPMSRLRSCAASFPGPFPWLPAPKSGKKDLGTTLRSCGEVSAAPRLPVAGNRACTSNESDCTIQFTWDVELLTLVTCGTMVEHTDKITRMNRTLHEFWHLWVRTTMPTLHGIPRSLRTQTYFRLSLVPAEPVTAGNTSAFAG